MKTYKEFIAESKNSDIHTSLKKMGMKDVTWDETKNLERKYEANHNVKDVHNTLIKHGYKMHTHTMSGHPMEPHLSYEGKAAPHAQNTVNLHHKDGKVKHISFNFRGDNS